MVSVTVKLCGLNLKSQCYTISLIQTATSFSLFILSLTMLIKPESFIKNFDQIENDDQMRMHYLNAVGANGMELVIGSITTFIASLCLIRGIRKNQTGFILPWLIISSVDLGATFMIFMMRVTTADNQIGYSKILAAILYHLIVSYFIYSVFVYYNIIKRQKKMAGKLVLQLKDQRSSVSSTDIRIRDVELPVTTYFPSVGLNSSNYAYTNSLAPQTRHEAENETSNSGKNWKPTLPRKLNEDPFSDDDEFVVYPKNSKS